MLALVTLCREARRWGGLSIELLNAVRELYTHILDDLPQLPVNGETFPSPDAAIRRTSLHMGPFIFQRQREESEPCCSALNGCINGNRRMSAALRCGSGIPLALGPPLRERYRHRYAALLDEMRPMESSSSRYTSHTRSLTGPIGRKRFAVDLGLKREVHEFTSPPAFPICSADQESAPMRPWHPDLNRRH